jgi:4-azaleucine resistance transporter AzlC
VLDRFARLLEHLAGRDPVRGSALAIGVAVGVFGVSFGVLARSSGLSVLQAQAMSVLVFTGASQFAAVGIVEGGGSLGAALSTGLLLAARNGLYGVALTGLLRGPLAQRALAAQLVIDESAAMAAGQRTPEASRRAFWLTGAAVFVCWNLGTLAGALGGGAIDDPEAFGLDVVFPASFLALVAPQLRGRRALATALLAAALALALVPFAPAGVPILVAASAALVALFPRPELAAPPEAGA